MISVIRLIATVFQPKKETERRDVAPPRLQFPEDVMVVKQTHRLSNGGYLLTWHETERRGSATSLRQRFCHVHRVSKELNR